MKKASISILFDKRNMAEGRFSVKWQVYYDGKQKAFPTGLILTDNDVNFLKTNKAGLTGRVKDRDQRNLWNRVYGESYVDPISGQSKEGILLKGKKALSVVEDYFTFEIFGQVVSGNFVPSEKIPTDSDMIKALENRGALLKKQGDTSNGGLHESAASSLRRYAVYARLAKSVETAQLPVMVVTTDFMKKYEKWMLQYGKAPQSKTGEPSPASISTVSIYTRYIRIIWNEAIDSNTVKADQYPFKTKQKKGYKIATVRNKKKALSNDVMLKLFAYKPVPGSSREKWVDMWLFIYMGNGLNPMDLCKIRNQDLYESENVITFFRDKTFDTKRDNMIKISIYLIPELKAIIEKHRNPDRSPNARLFPLIPNVVKPEQEKALVNQVTRNINQHMERVRKELRIEQSIKTYEARHTFATALTSNNVPIKAIAEMYGHSSIRTTERYIASIVDESAQNYISNIVPRAKEIETTIKGPVENEDI